MNSMVRGGAKYCTASDLVHRSSATPTAAVIRKHSSGPAERKLSSGIRRIDSCRGIILARQAKSTNAPRGGVLVPSPSGTEMGEGALESQETFVARAPLTPALSRRERE